MKNGRQIFFFLDKQIISDDIDLDNENSQRRLENTPRIDHGTGQNP